MKAVYLDNAATTFPKPEKVIQAVQQCLNSYVVNVSRGGYLLAKRAEREVGEARSLVSQFYDVAVNNVCFVPSATYAINTVIRGLSYKPGDVVYISPYEHNAVLRACETVLKHFGVEIKVLPFDQSANIDLDQVRSLFSNAPPRLVVVTHASNVTGDILPVEEIAQLTKEFGGLVLVDAAQTAGLYQLPGSSNLYDYICFSSHKYVYGIPGSGCLIINSEQLPQPLVYGGTGHSSRSREMPAELPWRYEAGTPNLPAIVSMKAGLEWLYEQGEKRIKQNLQTLCHMFDKCVEQFPEITVVGHRSDKGYIPVYSLSFMGYRPQEVEFFLSEKGVACRAGLHCAPLAHEHLSTEHGTCRFSLSVFNERHCIEALKVCFTELYY